MFFLREVLYRTLEISNQGKTKITFPEVQITSMADKIESSHSRLASPREPVDLDKIYEYLSIAANTNRWEEINHTIWKKACWVLWYGEEPLASNNMFINKYFEYIKNYFSWRQFKIFVWVYLRDFNQNMPGQREIAFFIRSHLNSGLIKNIAFKVWLERDKKYNLFDPEQNISTSVNEYINCNEKAIELLKKLGLEGQLEFSNYSQSIFVEFLNDIRNEFHAPNKANIIFSKVIDFAEMRNGKLRFPDQKIHLIESILSPWTQAQPSAELCNVIIEFLMKHFGDPRTNEGRSNWIGVDEDSLRVMRKWLAGATLEQFFSIIDSTAEDEHWRFRRKFWKAYYDEGYIDDAWIVLGEQSGREARLAYETNLCAGAFSGGGAESNHSALIFKVGDLTICEWSHRGKCRAWDSNKVNDKNLPRLYENEYKPDGLRTKSLKIVKNSKNDGISHHASEHYTWQRQLSEFIYERTSINIPSYKYRL